MTQFGWPDLLIGLICCFAAVAGFRRGFVGELSGAVAIVFALDAGTIPHECLSRNTNLPHGGGISLASRGGPPVLNPSRETV